MFQRAARFQTILALLQRCGFPESAAIMGVVGGVAALVIGAFPSVHEALKPLGLLVYVFLAALGGACGMVLYLIAPEGIHLWSSPLRKAGKMRSDDAGVSDAANPPLDAGASPAPPHGSV